MSDSGPRVYDGSKTVKVETTALRSSPSKPVSPVKGGDGSIFISVASYRDGERCAKTIQSIFENAEDPDKVIVGLVEQNNPDDAFCIEKYCESFGQKTIERKTVRKDVVKIMTKDRNREKCPRFDQIRLVAVFEIAAKGPMFARSMTRKILGNEEFCMQVDAHTSFAKNWDTALKEEWRNANNEFGIISSAPPPKDEMDDYKPGGSKENTVPRVCKVKFRENGFPDYDSPADGSAFDLERPLLSHTWSAGFSFAKCHLEESAPYDPFAPFAMPVEQFSRFARFWTRGYDVYTPTRNVVFHDYDEQPNGHGKNEWFKRQRDRFRKMTIQRVKTILQFQDGDSGGDAQANLGLYGLGKRRSLQQLQDFVNMDFMAKRGNVGANLKCVGHEWVPYDANGVSPMENLFDNPTDLEPQPEYPLRTHLTFYDPVAQNQRYDQALLIADEDAAAGSGDAEDAGVNLVRKLEKVKLLDSLAARAQEQVAKMGGRAGALGPGENSPAPPASASTLLVLWVFGLIVWCAMFLFPTGKLPASSNLRVRKKSNSNKDV